MTELVQVEEPGRRKGEVRVHAESLGVWEEDVTTTFERKVLGGLVVFLRGRGWHVMRDPHTKKHYRLISESHRLARKRPLFCKLDCSGRCIELRFWSTDFPSTRPDNVGHEYESDIRNRMPPTTRRRLDVEMKAVWLWLAERFGYTVDRDHDPRVQRTALEVIQADYATSWHTDKELGHPRPSASATESGDKGKIEQGATVWVRRHNGRVVRGTAYFSLNNTWNVVIGEYERISVPNWDVLTRPPENLRRCVPSDIRRDRLEHERRTAVENEDYDRAKLLRALLFGSQPTYLVCTSKHPGPCNYYATNSRGYATKANAGRFTAEEARRIVRYHKELTAVPVGKAPALTGSQEPT